MSNKNWKELFSRSLEQDGFNSEEVQRIFLIDMKATKFFRPVQLVKQSFLSQDN